MAKIQRIDTDDGPVCSHCGKWLGLSHYIDGGIAYGMPVGKKKMGITNYVDEDGNCDGDIDVKTEMLDYYLFCDECFAEVDIFFNDFVLYHRIRNINIKKKGD